MEDERMSIFGHIHNRDVNSEAHDPAKPTTGTDPDTGKMGRKALPAEGASRLLQLLIGSLALVYRRGLRTLAIEIFRAAVDADFDDRNAGDDHGVTWNAGSEFTIDREEPGSGP
jgi:hypothetical protein